LKATGGFENLGEKNTESITSNSEDELKKSVNSANKIAMTLRFLCNILSSFMYLDVLRNDHNPIKQTNLWYGKLKKKYMLSKYFFLAISGQLLIIFTCPNHKLLALGK